MDERFESILLKLKGHIIRMESLDDWLFVAVNTMKAIVDNSCKDDAAIVLKAAECSDTSEIQQLYDRIQGMYGREGFSYRNAPSYYYLSSLVARFHVTELTESDLESIKEYFGYDGYFMYKL